MPMLVPGGQAASAATYSFSSQPKPVTASRKKYREPGDADVSMYRDLKETCITWDKRVHRGNTYGMYTQNAIKEALQDAAQVVSPKPPRKRKPKEPALFDMPLPERERIPVDLSAHLIAKERVIQVDTVEAQTDEFLPEPPAEQFQPQKIGVDVHTQVEDGELFNFDFEVEPILDVLVNKTLEQSIMEVEEEHEMESMSKFKTEWYQRQEKMTKYWQTQVQEECARWGEKEAVMSRQREQKRREAQVLLKIQAMSTAKKHLTRLVPNAVGDLKEVAFPDERAMAINRTFMPQLLCQVKQQLQTVVNARHVLDQMVAEGVREQAGMQSDAFIAHRQRHEALERKRFEELQIRQGNIRIVIDTASGDKVSVGPIQLSSQETVEEVQDRVLNWLMEHEPDLASAWPCGVVLCINGEPVQDTLAIFEAKAGQISIVPKPEPPPPEDEEGEDAEDGGDVDGEGGKDA